MQDTFSVYYYLQLLKIATQLFLGTQDDEYGEFCKKNSIKG
jgi:hypothetical protein